MISGGALALDSRLSRALLDVLSAGRLPLPDLLLHASALPAPTGSAPMLWFDECRLAPAAGGEDLVLSCASAGCSLEATFYRGAAGLGAAGAGGGVACLVAGELSLSSGLRVPLAGARGLVRKCEGMDALTAAPVTRAAVALTDGGLLVVDGTQAWRHAAPSASAAAEGEVLCGVSLQASPAGPAPWLSTQTFSSYPQHLVVLGSGSSSSSSSGRSAASAPLTPLHLTAVTPACELVSLLACPGVWMGRMAVSDAAGSSSGAEGYGNVLQSLGAKALASLDTFFRAVGLATRDAVLREYPSTLSQEKVVQMVATSPEHAWHAQGAHAGQLEKGIIQPLRHLVDAGGKSWRGYGILAACDAVGGASHCHTEFLALAELLHVGSLIVDDLQDESPLRRGRRAVHLEFSPAVAINAATAAYFYCERIIMRGASSRQPKDTLRLMEQYFGCMRAGHAGQALDIAGLDYLMAEAVAGGDGALAEERLLAVHMLKTGVPAASLLRMGCVLGGGSDAQVMALGRYYEAVGCAFQIMDDVRNLRGVFSGSADKAGAGVELKVLGEDISAGKVTFPMVKALSLLPRAEMAALWEVVRSKPSERAVVDGVIAQLEACGAVEACVTHAARLVEEGYAQVDGVLPDSLWKCFLRAFGSYLVELPK